MTTATNRAARRLLAPTFTQQCVTCQVNAGWPCTDRRGKPIRRIHIARVRAYFADLLRGAESAQDATDDTGKAISHPESSQGHTSHPGDAQEAL